MSAAPRLSQETRQAAVEAAGRAISAKWGQEPPDTAKLAEAAVDAAVDVLWPKLLGDARDRVATALHAARGLLQAQGRVGARGLEAASAETLASKRRGLERALDALEHPAAWRPGATGPKGTDGS